MIPLKDDAPRITTPYITYFLLIFNIVIFLFEWLVQASQGRAALNLFVAQLGLVPGKIGAVLGTGAVPPELAHYLQYHPITAQAAFLPIITSMFLHGSWLHLIANMWALWIFGDNVEDHLGHFFYLVLYLLSGIAGGFVHTLFNLNSWIPTVGASGAIAGVMGAYFILFPKARVLTLVPFFFVFFVWLPAWVVLGYWFLAQFLSGAATSIATTSASSGGVAFWAHVGGFVTGLVFIKITPARPRRYHYGDWN